MILHQRTHPNLDVEGCFGCHCAGVDFSASSMPSRRPVANEKVAMEARWQTDHAAYRRMVKGGVQPPGLDGSAALERTL